MMSITESTFCNDVNSVSSLVVWALHRTAVNYPAGRKHGAAILRRARFIDPVETKRMWDCWRANNWQMYYAGIDTGNKNPYSSRFSFLNH